MKVKPIAEVISFLRPIAEKTGVELVDAVWNMRERSLTVFLDAEGGVDLVLCEKFHHAIDGPLDELDPTFGAPYTLNCSSCGLDRPLRTERDFARCIGERIEVHLYAPQDGKKYYEGELISFDGKNVTVLTEGGRKEFLFEKTAKICRYIEI